MPIKNQPDLQALIEDAGGLQKYARSVLDGFFSHADATPTQEEVSAETTVTGFRGLGFGLVTQCMDTQKSGRIKVQSDVFPEGPQTCDYVSPIAGAGYGLFAVPGIGSVVLVGKNPYNDDHPNNFWLGCLYAAGQREIPGAKSQPYVLGDAKQLIKSEVKDSGEPTGDGPTVSFGVPNEADVYKDNDLPDSFILKHPAGHSVTLENKNTPERQINEIKLKTAGNKRLIMSDAPADSGGEVIHLIDENDNQIKITSIGKEASQNDSIVTRAIGHIETTSEEGQQQHIVGKESTSDYSITNAGKGNITITCNNGEMVLDAAKSITLRCGGSTITLTPTGIDINTNTLNIKGGTGDVDVAGVTLRKHRHPIAGGSSAGITRKGK